MIQGEVHFNTVYPNPIERSILTTVWEEKIPEGNFLLGRHGYTHYVLDNSPMNKEGKKKSSSTKGLIVLLHGIGTSSHMYKMLSKFLTNEGNYTVLRYDFWYHGYSKFGISPSTRREISWTNPFTPDILVDQLEDVLEHVQLKMKQQQQEENDTIPFVAFVGHSTGGLVGIYAAQRWMKSRESLSLSSSSPLASSPFLLPQNMILISPALWAKKPFLSRIVDCIPYLFALIVKYIPSLSFLIADTYMMAGKIAFAMDTHGQYLYPKEQVRTTNLFQRLFGYTNGIRKHPYLEAGINAINWGMLRTNLYSQHRTVMTNVLQRNKSGACNDNESNTMKILHLWGTHDKTVPYNDTNIAIAQKWQQQHGGKSYYRIESMKNIGHDCIFENSQFIGNLLLKKLLD